MVSNSAWLMHLFVERQSKKSIFVVDRLLSFIMTSKTPEILKSWPFKLRPLGNNIFTLLMKPFKTFSGKWFIKSVLHSSFFVITLKNSSKQQIQELFSFIFSKKYFSDLFRLWINHITDRDNFNFRAITLEKLIPINDCSVWSNYIYRNNNRSLNRVGRILGKTMYLLTWRFARLAFGLPRSVLEKDRRSQKKYPAD